MADDDASSLAPVGRVDARGGKLMEVLAVAALVWGTRARRTREMEARWKGWRRGFAMDGSELVAIGNVRGCLEY